jgi:glucans biosynthesis protein
MFDRRQTLGLLGAALAFAGEGVAAVPARSLGAGRPFSWDWLRRHAAALARAKPRPLPQPDPRAHAVDYDAANRIAFRPDRQLFASDGVDDGYAVRLFPIVRNAPIPVRVSVVEGGRARPIEHSEDMFAVGPGEGPAPHIVPGIAGFRVMNRGGVGDWLAFLGASYFRSAGPLDQYGLSARGLAIDTGIDGAEEFPVFTAFWLERTGSGGAGGLTIYALLEGPSVVGAYRFATAKGSAEVVQDVSMALWLRRDVQRLGIAPLTSMFWYDEGNPAQRADWRPEIHDSDGLLIRNSAGERIWRPLGNPPRPTMNAFADPARGPMGGASGFGLLQRDRAFDHYQDDGVFYEKRPGLWVEPQGDWGPGAVMLYEIPSNRETDDNIVAFWTPDRPAKAGTAFAFDYRLRWIAGEPEPAPLARVVDRWTGTAGRPGLEPIADARRLVVDFEGAALQGLDRTSGVRAAVSVDRGRILSSAAYPVVGRPGRWRLIVDSSKTGAPTNLRATLERGDTPLSETVIHQFY